jgi:hypothetical protein
MAVNYRRVPPGSFFYDAVCCGGDSGGKGKGKTLTLKNQQIN